MPMEPNMYTFHVPMEPISRLSATPKHYLLQSFWIISITVVAILGIKYGAKLALRDHNGCLPQFDEELTIYEDKLWVIEAGARITSAVLLPDIFYHYIFLPTSLTKRQYRYH